MNTQLDIPTFLDRRPFVGTFTILKAVQNCQHQMWRRYIKKDQPYVQTEAQAFGDFVHKAMAKRVQHGIVLPEAMRDWEKHAAPFDQYKPATELELGVTREGRPTGFWDANVWFRGKVDVAIVMGVKAMITDWKTGSSKYEDEFELATGALLLKAHNPDITKVIGRYIYLKEDKLGPLHDLSDFHRTWQEMHQLMALIEQKRQSGEWIKKKSGLCGYCSVQDCEHYYVAKPK